MNPVVIAIIIVDAVLIALAGVAYVILYFRLRRALTARRFMFGMAKTIKTFRDKDD